MDIANAVEPRERFQESLTQHNKDKSNKEERQADMTKKEILRNLPSPGKLVRVLAIAIFFIGAFSAAEARYPVVFVHGYSGWGGQFTTMKTRFRNSGWGTNELFYCNYNSLTQSNKTSASNLRTCINNVRASTGKAKVNIVAHSNGGLVARYYKNKLGGATYINRLVTLGTPHKGTLAALLCVSPACFEMRPGSSFLANLGGGCDRSLWSACDEIINPDGNAKCGTSIQTSCLGHVLMLESSSVFSTVKGLVQ